MLSTRDQKNCVAARAFAAEFGFSKNHPFGEAKLLDVNKVAAFGLNRHTASVNQIVAPDVLHQIAGLGPGAMSIQLAVRTLPFARSAPIGYCAAVASQTIQLFRQLISNEFNQTSRIR